MCRLLNVIVEGRLAIAEDAGQLSSEFRLTSTPRCYGADRSAQKVRSCHKVQRDPLDAVIAVLAFATVAVKAGSYGPAPAGSTRDTPVYETLARHWRSSRFGQGQPSQRLAGQKDGLGWRFILSPVMALV